MNSQPPAYLANRPGRGIAQQAATGVASSQPARISIAGNRFTLVDSLGNARPVNFQLQDPNTGQMRVVQADSLDVVIIGANPAQSKVFFEGTFDPNSGENAPPTCFSDNGQAPSAQAQRPQAASCAMCPNNAWGSRVNAQTNGQSKLCADKKKLAVRLAPYFNDDTIYQLQIPPASLKHMAVYMNYVGSQDYGGRRVDVCDLITRISFESQGVLKFDTAGWYDDAFAGQIEADITGKADKIAWVTGINDVPRTAAIATPQQVPQLQAPAQQPSPVSIGAGMQQGLNVLAQLPLPVQQTLQNGPAQGHIGAVQQPQYAQPQPAQQGYAPVQPPQNYSQPQTTYQPQQPPAAPKTRRPRAGKGGVTEQPQTVPSSVAQPQPVPVQQPSPAPVVQVGAPAFLQPQSVQQPAATQFGMQQNPQLTSDDVAAKIAAAMAM